jgi:hypothetical protein
LKRQKKATKQFKPSGLLVKSYMELTIRKYRAIILSAKRRLPLAVGSFIVLT